MRSAAVAEGGGGVLQRSAGYHEDACGGRAEGVVDFASAARTAPPIAAPDIYLKTLKALGLTADKAIAVEDSPTGIASAKAAGLKVLALKPATASRWTSPPQTASSPS